MADQTQTQEQTQAGPDLSFLEGTGVDTENLSELIKKEAAENAAKAGITEAPPAPPAAKDTPPAVGGAETEVTITIKPDVKVGDEIKSGDVLAPDGEYERADKSIVTIKDGKIESIIPGEKPKPEVKKKGKETDIDNPFLGGEQEESQEDVPVKDFTQGAALLTKNLGIEVKSVEDLTKVIGRINELNTNISSLADEKAELEEYKATFEAMPDDLFAITQKWANGEDYHSEIQAIARMNIDFTKPFSNHNVKDLIELYNPGKFSEEDYQDMEDDKAMKAVVELTKAAYEKDRDRYKGVKERYAEQSKKDKAAFTKSVDSSIAALSKDVPYVKDHHKQRVGGILKSGATGILSLFIDDSGLMKPEAGKLVALAIYGEAAIASRGNIAKKEGQSEAVEEIVRRTPTAAEKKSMAGGAVPGGAESDEIKKFKDTVIPKVNQENPFMKASVKK